MLENTHFRKKYAYHQAGFTLIELLVVISIIGLLSSLVLANHHNSQKKYALSQATQQLISDLRKAQNMALASTEFGSDVPYAYGVYFEKQSLSSYILFADTNGNGKYDAPDGVVGNINLEKGIQIESFSVEPKLHINFLLPYALIEFNPSITEATIILKKEGGICPQDCKYIKMNDKGWMAIKNNP